jgi:hypothetical protein
VSASGTTNKTEGGWAPRRCWNAFSLLSDSASNDLRFWRDGNVNTAIKWRLARRTAKHKMWSSWEGEERGVTGTPARILPTKYKQKDMANSAEDLQFLQDKTHRTQLLLVFWLAGWLVISRRSNNYCSSQTPSRNNEFQLAGNSVILLRSINYNGSHTICHRSSIQSKFSYKNSAFACRIWRVLTMVYNTQNYWVSGVCPSSGILNTRTDNVSETGSTSYIIYNEIQDDLHTHEDSSPNWGAGMPETNSHFINRSGPH